jgi:hypothetical protein
MNKREARIIAMNIAAAAVEDAVDSRDPYEGETYEDSQRIEREMLDIAYELSGRARRLRTAIAKARGGEA